MADLEKHLPYALRQFESDILVPLQIFGSQSMTRFHHNAVERVRRLNRITTTPTRIITG